MAKKLLWNGSDEVVVKYAQKDSHGEDIDIADIDARISHLQGIGHFLSLWNSSTGVAATNPPSSPYIYHTGDYFRVNAAASDNYNYITSIMDVYAGSNE